jgi:hypothetical protein
MYGYVLHRGEFAHSSCCGSPKKCFAALAQPLAIKWGLPPDRAKICGSLLGQSASGVELEVWED